METGTRTSESSHKAKKNLWRKFSKLAIKAESEVKVTGEHLGKGAFAEVIALEIDGVRCAGKKLHNVLLGEASEKEREALTDSFAEECIRMSELRHPNIVQLLGIHIDESNTIILLMEYMPMCLTDCLEKYPKLPDFMKTSILLDIARGLLYLHRQTPPIIHRDLSTNNVLLSLALQAKICDLGVARKLKKKELTSGFALMSLAPGNPLHMPPEALKMKEAGKAEYNIKLDCFSFGHVILEVVHQQSPLLFMMQADPDNPDKPVENEVKRRSYYLQMMTDHPLHSLATRCLQNEPALRPGSVQIVKELKKIIQAYPPPIDFRNPVVMYELFQEASQKISELEKEVAKLRRQAQMQAPGERNQVNTPVSKSESEVEQHITSWQTERSVSKGEDNAPVESHMDTKTTRSDQTNVAMWTHASEDKEDGPIPQSQQLPEATQPVVPSKPETKQPLGPQQSVPISMVTKQPPVPRPKPRTGSIKSRSTHAASESLPPYSPVHQSHSEQSVPTSTVTKQPPVPRPKPHTGSIKSRSSHVSESPPPSSPVHQSHSEQTSAVKKQPPVPRPKPLSRAGSAASVSPPSSSPVHQSHSEEPSHHGSGVIGYALTQPDAQVTPHQDSTTPISQLQLSDVASPGSEVSAHITHGTEEGENRSAEELEGSQDLVGAMKKRKWMEERSHSLEGEPTPVVSELQQKLSTQRIKADKGNPGEGYEQLERKRMHKITSLDEPGNIDPKLREMLDRRWHRIPSEDQN